MCVRNILLSLCMWLYSECINARARNDRDWTIYLFLHEHLSALFYCHRSPDAQHWFVLWLFCRFLSLQWRRHCIVLYACFRPFSSLLSSKCSVSLLHAIAWNIFENRLETYQPSKGQSVERIVVMNLFHFGCYCDNVASVGLILCMGRQNYKRNIAPPSDWFSKRLRQPLTSKAWMPFCQPISNR